MTERNFRLLASALAAAALALAAANLRAAGDAHHHHAAPAPDAPRGLTLNQGRKWSTDAPLRRGMGNIRSLVDKYRHAAPNQTSPATSPQALAKEINAEVNYIFQNCRLEKRADEMLHLVLADIMNGSGTLEKGPAAARAKALDTIVHAVNNYGRYFDHPGWTDLR